jgi:Tol biopolymer transport system component
VAFASYATNLVSNDTNGAADVFVYDTTLNTIECASVDQNGKPGNGTSWWASMSDDGRYVAFLSDATNLVTGDTNGRTDIFVRDRQLARTYRVSVGAGGAQSTGNSRDPFISATGRYVFFKSSDGNLVAGDTNGYNDGFVYDMATGATICVSVDDSGNLANGDVTNCMGISADGRWAVYQSTATNLVQTDGNTACDIFLRGPLWTTQQTYSLSDAASALSIAAGLATATQTQQYWLDLVRTSGSLGKVDIQDAVAVARKAAGLDSNP